MHPWYLGGNSTKRMIIDVELTHIWLSPLAQSAYDGGSRFRVNRQTICNTCTEEVSSISYRPPGFRPI